MGLSNVVNQEANTSASYNEDQRFPRQTIDLEAKVHQLSIAVWAARGITMVFWES
jgi:hypothetical protein